jgi:hypothetical protein
LQGFFETPGRGRVLSGQGGSYQTTRQGKSVKKGD